MAGKILEMTSRSARYCSAGGKNYLNFSMVIAVLKLKHLFSSIFSLEFELFRWFGQGHDRVRIDLPGAQKQLARAVLKLGKPTVIVLLNAGMCVCF